MGNYSNINYFDLVHSKRFILELVKYTCSLFLNFSFSQKSQVKSIMYNIN